MKMATKNEVGMHSRLHFKCTGVNVNSCAVYLTHFETRTATHALYPPFPGFTSSA